MNESRSDQADLSEGGKAEEYRHRSSAEIERDIETTLQEIDHSLTALEEKFAIREAFGSLYDFFTGPAGKALAIGALVSFARRKPLLTLSLGAVYLYYWKRTRDQSPESRQSSPTSLWKEMPMTDKSKERETPPTSGKYAKGPQTKSPIMAIEAGSEITSDGEYVCEGCGHRAYMEKAIIVPACPDCGGSIFHKEGD